MKSSQNESKYLPVTYRYPQLPAVASHPVCGNAMEVSLSLHVSWSLWVERSFCALYGSLLFLVWRKLIDLSSVSSSHPSQPTTWAGQHLRTLHRLPMTISDITHHGPDLSPGGPLSSFASCRRPHQALNVSSFVTLLRPDQWCYHPYLSMLAHVRHFRPTL